MKQFPKQVRLNLRQRRRLLQRCQEDVEFRHAVWIRCARDFVFWCDAFAWTLATKQHAKCPKAPFILYGVQERAAQSLLSALGKEDRLVEKSRDMGATWLILAVFVWLFIFRSDQSFLVGSRKQEFVDKTGDPKCLFWKIDFLLARLPWWMRPPILDKVHRRMNHIENPLNGSVIDGESTNENFGAGDRRTAVLLDEFALVDLGYSILSAVGDVADCVFYNSAPGPAGASGAFFDVRQKMAAETPDRLIRLHWSEHPLKRRGLYTSRDGVLEVLDQGYRFPAGYRFILDGKLRSVAYDDRERRAPNKQVMASQWDIDYLKSGYQFFNPLKLDGLIRDQRIVFPPLVRGELIRDPDWRTVRFIDQGGGGRLQLWVPLPADGKWPFDDVVIGADIAAGSGGELSSNSSASIVRKSTGEKIGELTDNLINPHDFALYCLAMAVWFNGATLIWERNGPNGSQFGKVILDSGYTKLFFARDDSRLGSPQSKKPGWWTTDDNKPSLLGQYAEALWSGSFTNHSELALLECSQYVQIGKKIEHSRSLASATTDQTAIGESHGDRVIADSLAYRAIQDAGGGLGESPQVDILPINSAAYRRRQRDTASVANSEYEWD